MAGLITIADVETAIGSDIASSDEARVQWYIDVVSKYVETYTDQSFTTVTAEPHICETDRRGAVEFSTLNAVTKVELLDPWLNTYTEVTSGNYAFDGVGTVYGLLPFRTYKITVTYGWGTVPVDVKGVVMDLVLAGTGLGAGATGGLIAYRVGDVEEAYGVSTFQNGGPIITLASMQRAVLDAYVRTTRTWRM
jgi:hypothetical protein